MMRRWIWLMVLAGLGCLISLLSCSPSYAHTPSEAEFLAATLTADELSAWIKGLNNPPKSVSIFSVRPVAPLDSEYASVMETEIVKRLRADNTIRVTSCLECRAPQIQVKGERLIITKGAPDLESLKALAKKGDAEAFLVVDIYRTSLSVVTQATLHEGATGEIIDSTRSKIPALDVANSAMQFMLGMGPGLTVGGAGSSSTSNVPPLTGSLSILEELGFGKGGFNIGGVATPGSSYGFIMPELAWRGLFAGSALYSLKSIGVGFGIGSQTSGVAARVAYDLFLGSFTFVGLEVSGLVPVKNFSSDTLQGFAGVHFGLSLGR